MSLFSPNPKNLTITEDIPSSNSNLQKVQEILEKADLPTFLNDFFNSLVNGRLSSTQHIAFRLFK